MSSHLKPKANVITERYKFKERKQQEMESVSSYIAALKNIASNCQFEENLENNLRDQIVWGLKDETIKKRLLSESTLKYKKTVEMATAMEGAVNDVRQLSTSTGATPRLNMVKANIERRNENGQTTKKCFVCGKTNHMAPWHVEIVVEKDI